MVQKLRNFRNLWCARTDKGEGAFNQCGHFSDKEGVNFCADVFYGWSLMFYKHMKFRDQARICLALCDFELQIMLSICLTYQSM